MSDYTLTQQEYRRLKTRLTTRINKLNKVRTSAITLNTKANQEAVQLHAKQLIAEADYANGIFEKKGYPDAWSNWERAKDDAESALRFSKVDWSSAR